MAKGKPQCWDCNGSGVVVYWVDSRKVEETCGRCGGSGEK